MLVHNDRSIRLAMTVTDAHGGAVFRGNGIGRMQRHVCMWSPAPAVNHASNKRSRSKPCVFVWYGSGGRRRPCQQRLSNWIHTWQHTVYIYIYEMGSFVFFLVYSRPEQRQLLAQSDSSGHAREDKILVACMRAAIDLCIFMCVVNCIFVYSRIVKSV